MGASRALDWLATATRARADNANMPVFRTCCSWS